MKISIFGAGTWGVALARTLSLKFGKTMIWSCIPAEVEQLADTREHPNLPDVKIPDCVDFTTSAEEAVLFCDCLIMAVPSIYIRQTARLLVPFLKAGQTVICASKGIEKETLMTLSEVISDEITHAGIRGVHLAAISGPTHAEEVSRDMPTLLVAASPSAETAREVQSLFEGTCIRAYTNTDIKGVEICGALKNVEALAVGIASGLGYGDNTRAALITRGMEEIRRLGLAMGCSERTFFGLAGIGDLIVTATSRHSRNNRAGNLIGQGKAPEEAVREVGMVVEGINALPAAVSLCHQFHMDMPLIQSVNDIVFNGAKPREIVDDLMNRKLKQE